MDDIELLLEFLKYPLGSGDAILKRFAGLPETTHSGKPTHCVNPNNSLEQFVYIPGKRDNKVVLVAHADTFWDKGWNQKHHAGTIMEHELVVDENIIRSGTPDFGIGADDRAGCAILWLLKDLGHSLLITNGEEHGQLGSNWLMNSHPDIANGINKDHQFMVEVDRRNGNDFKCYQVGTENFREYINKRTGYVDAGRDSYTDICTLCRDICGVNLSIGYKYEHHDNEEINIKHWQKTLGLCREWLNEPILPYYSLL